MNVTGAQIANLRKSIRWWVACTVLAVLAAIILASVRHKEVANFVYGLAAKRLMNGEEIYRIRDSVPGFTYPPFMALAYLAVIRLPSFLERVAWYVLNLMMLGYSYLLITRPLMPSLEHPKTLSTHRRVMYFHIVLLTSIAVHLFAPIGNQSHDPIILLLLALFVQAGGRRKEWMAGAFGGFATAAKATPLLFLLVLLWQRRWTAASTMILVTVTATLLPDLLFPRSDGRLWVASWFWTFVSKTSVGAPPKAENAWTAWNMLNQSLAGSLYRLLTPVPIPSPYTFDVSILNPGPDTTFMIILATQLLVVVLLLWVTLPPRNVPRNDTNWLTIFNLGTVSAVASTMVLLSPMSSKANFCVLMAPLALNLAYHAFYKFSFLGTVLFGTAALLGLTGGRDILGHTLYEWFQSRGANTWCALACLLGTGLVMKDLRSTYRN